MDEEIPDTPKLPSVQSVRPSIVSQIIPEVVATRSSAVEQISENIPELGVRSSEEKPISPRQFTKAPSPKVPSSNAPSPKVPTSKAPSPIVSPRRISPLYLAPTSPPKGSIHMSIRSDKSNNLSLTQVNKNLVADAIRTTKDLFQKPKSKEISKHNFDQKDNGFVSNIMTDLQPSKLQQDINKITEISKTLNDEANLLRKSIKSLSEDTVRAKEDVNFPYHLFLLEIIINKIYMKCDCFELDCNNLVISVTFLGKKPIVLYDSSYGKIEDFNHINVGKSTLFAMTYDKICNIKEFIINLQLTKQPPCSNCISKLAECKVDYTKEFVELRQELCKKWTEEQPNDAIICTTSTPLNKNIYYLLCSQNHSEYIGIIELTNRMSFLGKEITTAFSARCKPNCTSVLTKEDNGMSMYTCQNVEMDGEGKILLDENTLNKREIPRSTHTMSPGRTESPVSQFSSGRGSTKQCVNYTGNTSNIYNRAGLGEFRIRDLNDEINKLMREKRHWEVQIKALGGPDHARVGPKMLDQDGKEVPGNRGYKYFGAAKDLPGVRELFEQEPPAAPRRTRADLMRDVDADYYGYRDDDDGLLLPLEKEAELDAIARAVEEWKKNKEENKNQELPEEENIYPEDPDDKRIDEDIVKPTVTSHVAVPSQRDVEEALLRRKKQELLEKYGCLDVKMEES